MIPKGILTLIDGKLRCSTMPLGGIGTGSIAIGGDGLLKQWQINNNVNHRSFVPNSFFAVRTRQLNSSNGKIISRALISSKPHEEPNFIPAKSIGDHKITKETCCCLYHTDNTITHKKLPNEFHMTYDTKGMFNKQENYFEQTPEGHTKWKSIAEFIPDNFMMKVMTTFMKGVFKKQTMKYMTDFKNFTEKGTSVANA